MGEVIGGFLPTAVGVAISPLPIVAVILMLFTPRARSNSIAFALGWLGGLVALFALVLTLADPEELNDASSGPSDRMLFIQSILGALLLLVAAKQWRSRPAEGVEPALPKWMLSIDKMTPILALVFGALMSAVNPKNLMLGIAGAVDIVKADLSSSDEIIASAVFILIASASVVGVVIWYLLAGESAEATLNRMKTWLLHNNAVVMAVLLLIIGLKLLGQGIGGLV